ncbi:MAG: hypothetical protein JRD94_08610, partial [Deltaproteobacteria bacterium]|nr:hypothetical protein [Deltaproteobacteria bacterium]
AEFLENALSMTVEAEIVGDAVEVEVAITNDQTGHHVPTGVTIRNMILLVEASQNGEPLEHTGSTVIHDLGGVGDPAEGYYAGLPGRLYGKINISEAGGSPTFFTDAVAIVSDNRIPALATDTTDFTFTVPPEGGDIEISARVIYRRSWRALVDGKDWHYDGHGNPLEDIAPPHFGHLMASAEKTLSNGAPMPDGGVPDGGAPDGGAPDGGAPDGGAPDWNRQRQQQWVQRRPDLNAKPSPPSPTPRRHPPNPPPQNLTPEKGADPFSYRSC